MKPCEKDLERMHWAYNLAQRIGRAINRDVVCAGGSCRDMWLRREPKDYDFFVLDPGPVEQGEVLEDYLDFELVPALRREFPGAEFQVYPTYREDKKGRIDYVVKFIWDDVQVDLVCFCGGLSLGEQLRQFDANVNQVCLVKTTGDEQVHLGITAEALDGFRNKVVRMTPHCDGDRLSRAAYLAEKLGFTIDLEVC